MELAAGWAGGGPFPDALDPYQPAAAYGLATAQTKHRGLPCGLYLDVEAGDGAIERLRAALAVATVEAVLIRPAPGRELSAAAVRPLVSAAQARNAAAIVCGDPDLALSTQADGVHLPWSEDIQAAYQAARRILGPKRIVGGEAGAIRHDAMVLAEAGADYIAFAPHRSSASDHDPSHEKLLELVSWWSEIFEVPCVAMGSADLDEAVDLCAGGADFIGWRLPAGESPAAAAERFARLVDTLAQRQNTRAEATPHK